MSFTNQRLRESEEERDWRTRPSSRWVICILIITAARAKETDPFPNRQVNKCVFFEFVDECEKWEDMKEVFKEIYTEIRVSMFAQNRG